MKAEFAAHLFRWIQGADFYRDLHKEAVAALPPGQDRHWIDVGCGPGLVARLAAQRGYRATGIDRNPAMVRAAQDLNKVSGQGRAPEFRAGDLASLPEAQADVISAASLLAVLPDGAHGLELLWRGVRPGGHLLVIEPTARMNPRQARQLLRTGLPGRRTLALRLWAAARAGQTVDPLLLQGLKAERRERLSLLNGMVEAWIFQKGDPLALGL